MLKSKFFYISNIPPRKMNSAEIDHIWLSNSIRILQLLISNRMSPITFMKRIEKFIYEARQKNPGWHSFR